MRVARAVVVLVVLALAVSLVGCNKPMSEEPFDNFETRATLVESGDVPAAILESTVALPEDVYAARLLRLAEIEDVYYEAVDLSVYDSVQQLREENPDLTFYLVLTSAVEFDEDVYRVGIFGIGPSGVTSYSDAPTVTR